MPRAGPSSIALRESLNESSDESENEQPDAPRVAQWVDEEELDEGASSSDDLGRDEENSDLTALKRDLSKLPLGALVKAHRVIKTVSESENDDSDDSNPSEESEINKRETIHAVATTFTQRNKKSIEHRSNKHAPTEVTSKKPVPRRRQVVDVHTVQPRDPRFSGLSGSLSADRFRSQYGFLSELHTEELSTLKQSLARARKLLISSPRDLREEREEEVKRLELALKRAESTVNREKREEAEQRALRQLQREEKDKRKAGKKDWWLKDADKKAVRVRARMDSIAASGGKRAVKKAIEKKQRKIGQKEKKSRPFAPPHKRPREEERTPGNNPKRRRMK